MEIHFCDGIFDQAPLTPCAVQKEHRAGSEATEPRPRGSGQNGYFARLSGDLRAVTGGAQFRNLAALRTDALRCRLAQLIIIAFGLESVGRELLPYA